MTLTKFPTTAAGGSLLRPPGRTTVKSRPLPRRFNSAFSFSSRTQGPARQGVY